MNDGNELISIIVPVYNVEQYLPKCIESIINQTYKKLEIILIDDESLDGSGIICDKYKNIDDRIVVIHKKNGGVADTRNVGVQHATGKYIGFVDSDDFIESTMFERLYNNLKKYNASISMCSFTNEYKSGRIEIGKHFEGEITLLNKKQAMENLILEQNLSNHVWNKLYERKIFENIVFPIGRKLEDVATLYKVFEKAEVLVYDNFLGYHYMQHKDSIMGNINESLINDYEIAVFEKNKYIEQTYPELHDAIEVENIKTYKVLYYYAKLKNYKDIIKSDTFKNYYKLYKKKYLKYRKQVKKNVGAKVLLTYDIFWISKQLYFIYLNLKKGKWSK